jgi:DNA excision repair protein ERCC-4
MKAAEPRIIIDTREQDPLVFQNMPSEVGTLTSGDYSLAGLEHHFAVERKSIDDLVGSVSRQRERFEREMCRLRGCEFRRLLVVGTRKDIENGAYHSKMQPKAVLASLDALEIRFSVPVVFAADPAHAARLVERWAFLFWREQYRRIGVRMQTEIGTKPGRSNP